MIRSILAATDLSEGSDNVLRAAAALARQTGAQLHLLHAFEFESNPYGKGDSTPATMQGLLDKADAALDAQIERTISGAAVASRELVIFIAFKAIRDRARAVNADLIVLGKNKSGGAGAFLGGTADRVIRSVDVPCLIIGRPLRMPLNRVVVPIDLSEPALGALDVALQWAGSLASADRTCQLVVLHVIPQVYSAADVPLNADAIGADVEREIAAAQARAEIKTAVDIRQEVRWADSVPDEIRGFLETENADLVVIGTHGHGAFKRALIGSVAAGVARAAPCPVLLVPPALWGDEQN
jgi:nucleotide-binding universal stress UspA family protein